MFATGLSISWFVMACGEGKQPSAQPGKVELPEYCTQTPECPSGLGCTLDPKPTVCVEYKDGVCITDEPPCPAKGCPVGDKPIVCLDLENTVRYPGPCLVEERSEFYGPAPDGYALDQCVFTYKDERVTQVWMSSHDDGGDGWWGAGNFTYDGEGQLSRYDYWSTDVIAASCSVGGSVVWDGDRVIVAAGPFCEDWPPVSQLLEQANGSTVYSREDFALIPLYPCDVEAIVPQGRVLEHRKRNSAGAVQTATCARTEIETGHYLDRCTLPDSDEVTLERDVVLDETGRTLSFDGRTFTYDSAGEIESIVDGNCELRYRRDAAGNPVHAFRRCSYPPYDLYDDNLSYVVFDYSCWQ